MASDFDYEKGARDGGCHPPPLVTNEAVWLTQGERINVRVLSKNCPERERLLWPINESLQEVKVSAAS